MGSIPAVLVISFLQPKLKQSPRKSKVARRPRLPVSLPTTTGKGKCYKHRSHAFDTFRTNLRSSRRVINPRNHVRGELFCTMTRFRGSIVNIDRQEPAFVAGTVLTCSHDLSVPREFKQGQSLDLPLADISTLQTLSSHPGFAQLSLLPNKLLQVSACQGRIAHSPYQVSENPAIKPVRDGLNLIGALYTFCSRNELASFRAISTSYDQHSTPSNPPFLKHRWLKIWLRLKSYNLLLKELGGVYATFFTYRDRQNLLARDAFSAALPFSQPLRGSFWPDSVGLPGATSAITLGTCSSYESSRGHFWSRTQDLPRSDVPVSLSVPRTHLTSSKVRSSLREVSIPSLSSFPLRGVSLRDSNAPDSSSNTRRRRRSRSLTSLVWNRSLRYVSRWLVRSCARLPRFERGFSGVGLVNSISLDGRPRGVNVKGVAKYLRRSSYTTFALRRLTRIRRASRRWVKAHSYGLSTPRLARWNRLLGGYAGTLTKHRLTLMWPTLRRYKSQSRAVRRMRFASTSPHLKGSLAKAGVVSKANRVWTLHKSYTSTFHPFTRFTNLNKTSSTNSSIVPYFNKKVTGVESEFTTYLSHYSWVNFASCAHLLKYMFYSPVAASSFPVDVVSRSAELNLTTHSPATSSVSSNISLVKSTNFVLRRRLLRKVSESTFAPEVTLWYYRTLIRFIENCSGRKVALRMGPFLENALTFEDRARCRMWSDRVKSFQKILGHRIFADEALRLVALALRLKDPTFLANWIRGMLKRLSFWKIRLLFRYIKFLIRHVFKPNFDHFSFKGFKLRLKGKISVAGNARSRALFIRVGNTSHSTAKNKIAYDLSYVNTFTGVLGFKLWFFF